MSYRYFHTLVIGITNRCSAKCNFCILECDKSKKNDLDITEIYKVLDCISKYPSIHTVALTGGEAFLDYEKAKKIFERAFQYKKRITFYTNGFWCTSYDVAYSRIYELKNLGLRQIFVSVDAEHQKYVKTSNIKNLLAACNSLNILVKIHSVIQRSTFHETEKILQELNEDKIGASVTMSSVLPCGSAKLNVKENDYIYNRNIDNITCSYDNMAYINSYGDVYPCCMGCAPSVLKLGNIKNDNIISILNHASDNIYFKTIINHGLKWYVDRIKEYGFYPIKEKYVSECHLCYDIFSDEKLCKELTNLVLLREA
jgi:MoaA/NifB/PqqE/SkfB family radical SAM enzyme